MSNRYGTVTVVSSSMKFRVAEPSSAIWVSNVAVAAVSWAATSSRFSRTSWLTQSIFSPMLASVVSIFWSKASTLPSSRAAMTSSQLSGRFSGSFWSNRSRSRRSALSFTSRSALFFSKPDHSTILASSASSTSSRTSVRKSVLPAASSKSITPCPHMSYDGSAMT